MGAPVRRPGEPPEVQTLWLDRADSTDTEVSDDVYARCSVYYGACEPIVTALLGKLEARSRRPPFTFALLRVILAETTDKAQRARAVDLAIRIVDDEGADDVLRSLTLDVLVSGGEASAPVPARKHQGSKHALLRTTATEILARVGHDGGAETGRPATP